MEFLKSIFGEKPLSYEEFVQAINAHNGNEANKENLIKLANLGSGAYVSKDKFAALETDKNGLQSKLDEANGLIETLKKSAKNDEAAQQKITDYETRIGQLETELQKTKLENAVNLAIRDAKGLDADYLAYKLSASGDLELDENGKIKGIDEKITVLKTQYPNQFEGASNDGLQSIPQKLPEGDGNRTTEPQNLADAIAQNYNQNK